jgi:DNA repair exonuclease SbcCD ATPase subunit
MLESELFGTASSADTSMKQVGHSFKEKIESVAGQVDEVKSRVSAIEGNSLLGEATKLEEECRTVGSKVGHLFATFGIDGLANPAKTVPSGGNMAPLKVRLTTYSGYADNVLRDLTKLEYEVLGNSYSRPEHSQNGAASIKDSAALLAEKLNDIQGRANTVANAPIANDVNRMEADAHTLSSRALALARRAGLESKISQQSEASPPQGSTLKERAAALEAYLRKVQSSIALLEDELAGNAGEVPAQLQKDSTLKSQAKLIQLRVENLNARLSTLEQQV